MTDNMRARPSGTGSHASRHAASGVDGPSGFDPAREYDFTGPSRWGHALHSPTMHEGWTDRPPLWRRWLLGQKSERFSYLSALGHSTPTPNRGDILRVAMQSGRVARFRIVTIKWMGDPRDMFDVKRADFVGYEGRDTDRSGEAGQTAKQAGPEGREPGPNEDSASPNPQPRSS